MNSVRNQDLTDGADSQRGPREIAQSTRLTPNHQALVLQEDRIGPAKPLTQILDCKPLNTPTQAGQDEDDENCYTRFSLWKKRLIAFTMGLGVLTVCEY
jgi:hypothetical protein